MGAFVKDRVVGEEREGDEVVAIPCSTQCASDPVAGVGEDRVAVLGADGLCIAELVLGEHSFAANFTGERRHVGTRGGKVADVRQGVAHVFACLAVPTSHHANSLAVEVGDGDR